MPNKLETAAEKNIRQDREREAMSIFAGRFGLTPRQAVILPALFGRVATEAGRSIGSIVNDATYSNRKLGEYIARIARELEVAAWAALKGPFDENLSRRVAGLEE